MVKLIDANVFEKRIKQSTSSKSVKTLSLVLLKTQEKIDPIHVAGGCYCKECVYYKSYEFPESNKKIYQCYNQCASYLEERKPHDFCSRGKKK